MYQRQYRRLRPLIAWLGCVSIALVQNLPGVRGCSAEVAPVAEYRQESLHQDVHEELKRRLHALFLRHFCTLVTWPESAFENVRSPLVVAVVGRDPLGSHLDRVFEDFRTPDGRSVVLQRLGSFENTDEARLRACHLILVAEPDRRTQGRLIQAVAKQPVLLVAESAGFVKAGGTIQLFQEDNHPRFEVNQRAAAESGIRCSSDLLRLSRKAPVRQTGGAPQ